MNKIIPDGSLIAVYYNYPIQNLKDGYLVVFNSNYDYGIKHYYDAGDRLIFKPDSTDISYTDIVIKKDEHLEIVGMVVNYTVVLD